MDVLSLHDCMHVVDVELELSSSAAPVSLHVDAEFAEYVFDVFDD